MRQLTSLLAVGLAGTLLAAPVPDEAGPWYIDLQPKATHKLADNSPSGMPGNNLGSLPTGVRELGGVKFKIGEGYLQLGSPLYKLKRPTAVEGIKVGRTLAKLYLLHGTAYGTAAPGAPRYIADGAVIAEYRVRYEDGKSEVIKVVYGKDVRDYWFSKDSPSATRGKVAWEGDNAAAKRLSNRLRLYRTTWVNPRPRKRVESIDYVKPEKNSSAAPFCVAMTAE
jgi:hypothetical protein